MNSRDAAFVERMTAAASHEIMNGLASIGQASGLMGDLLDMGLVGPGKGPIGALKKALGASAEAKPDTLGRFKKALGAVRGGLDKALESGRALNRFSHSLTPQETSAKGHDLAWALVVLMRRAARQRRAEIITGKLNQEVRITAPLLPLYQALTACADALLALAEPKDEVGVTLDLAEGRAVFSLKGPKGRPAPGPWTGQVAGDLEGLQDELAAMDCRVDAAPEGYVVSLPASPA